MFECDGDEHVGRPGRLALLLLPTAEGAESDSEETGERFLCQVQGLANLHPFTGAAPRARLRDGTRRRGAGRGRFLRGGGGLVPNSGGCGG